MVEVMTGGGFDANDVQNLIAAAPKSNSALPANPAANVRLASLEEGLAALPASQAAPANDMASGIPIPKPKPLPTLRMAMTVAEAAAP
jgi:hypothetical protein